MQVICNHISQPNWNQGWHQQSNGAQGSEYSPAQLSGVNTPSTSTTATENIFQFSGMTADGLQSACSDGGLTKDSWIYDSGSSWHICNNWYLMEDVVQGEMRMTTTANGGIQSSNLFGRVKIVP